MAPTKKIYIQDLFKSGTLAVVPVFSTVPRGRIREIILPDMPRGYGTIGASDIPGEKALTLFGESFPLFTDWEVSFHGQVLFLLYGPDEDRVLKFRDAVDIEYETDYSFLGFKGYKEDQIYRERNLKKGPRRQEREGDRREERIYEIPLQPHEMDNRMGAYAMIEKKRLHVYGTSQWPFLNRRLISEAIDIPVKDVVFRCAEGAPPSDGPLWLPSLITTHTALATWITRQPCRMLLPLEESRIGREERAPSVIKITSILNSRNELKKQIIDASVDGGAFPILSDELMDRLCLSLLGTEPPECVDLKARIIRTSSPPLDNFNGLGMSQGFFATELHKSETATLNSHDPLIYRREHCPSLGDPFVTGGSYREKSNPRELLDRVEVLSDFSRKFASYQNRRGGDDKLIPLNPRRGIGTALSYQGSGFITLGEKVENYTVSVKLDTDGEVTILTSSVPSYPRTREVWRETAAEILQIEQEKVHFRAIDTDRVPNSGPALFSRNVVIIPRLIEQCCTAIQKKRFRAPLPIEIKKTFRTPKTSQWDRESFTGQPFLTLSWAAAALELEMNPLTCAPEIRGIWMAVNCGRLLNSDYSRTVLEASILRSLRWCTEPAMKYGTVGPFTSENPTVPPTGLPITLEFIQNRGTPSGGIGTLADNTIPAAFAAALTQALGRPINRLPVIPGELLKAGED